MTLGELLVKVTGELKKANLEEPALEARHLLSELLNMSVSDVVLREITVIPEVQVSHALAWAAQRGKGVPLAYLAGRKGFYGFDFLVRDGVLIPRPETELIVDVALRRAGKGVASIADLGCGSGCIGLTLLKKMPQSHLLAIDASDLACETTLENSVLLNVEERVELVHSKVEACDTNDIFDLIVANPPYIPEGDVRVQASVHAHEPHLALYSGPDGLSAIRAWTAWAAGKLRAGGLLILEVGAGQSAEVQEIITSHFVDLEIDKDLQGIARVISARQKG